MALKYVYVLVSRDGDYYAEQTWASMWSLKHYNPDSHLTLVADDETVSHIKNDVSRRGMLELTDEVVSVKVPDDYSNMEKSRYLKTSLRNLVDGDFLFIDGDTLITDDLRDVTKLKCQIGAVPDGHLEKWQDHYDFEKVSKAAREIFGITEYPSPHFNSGVIYCKDNKDTRQFYSEWHENWKFSNSKGYHFDQLSLYVTCLNHPGFMEIISGEWNCMITVGLNYLCTAKIMHFFSASNTTFTPFKDKSTFLKIKAAGAIDNEMQELILNCKHNFTGPILIKNKREMAFDLTPARNLCFKFYAQGGSMWKVLNKISAWVLGGINRRKKHS